MKISTLAKTVGIVALAQQPSARAAVWIEPWMGVVQFRSDFLSEMNSRLNTSERLRIVSDHSSANRVGGTAEWYTSRTFRLQASLGYTKQSLVGEGVGSSLTSTLASREYSLAALWRLLPGADRAVVFVGGRGSGGICGIAGSLFLSSCQQSVRENDGIFSMFWGPVVSLTKFSHSYDLTLDSGVERKKYDVNFDVASVGLESSIFVKVFDWFYITGKATAKFGMPFGKDTLPEAWTDAGTDRSADMSGLNLQKLSSGNMTTLSANAGIAVLF